jgi:hypothetical protein
MTPKIPKPTPPPPPVSVTGEDKANADLEARKKMAGRYNFQDTILAPAGGLKKTMA